jgi:hypothetical protein
VVLGIGKPWEFDMHDRSYSDDEITPWLNMMTMPIRQGLYQLRLRQAPRRSMTFDS